MSSATPFHQRAQKSASSTAARSSRAVSSGGGSSVFWIKLKSDDAKNTDGLARAFSRVCKIPLHINNLVDVQHRNPSCGRHVEVLSPSRAVPNITAERRPRPDIRLPELVAISYSRARKKFHPSDASSSIKICHSFEAYPISPPVVSDLPAARRFDSYPFILVNESSMSTKLDLSTLQSAICGSAAAFRSRSTLQPAAGDGTKVFPPTYDKAAYATEDRRVQQPDGTFVTTPCVLLDSVQAQANRLEDALQTAIDAGRFAAVPIPVVQVDFPNEGLLNAVGKVTSLQAPHRIADAILRDSLLDGKPFRKSEIGEKLDHVSLQNATPLYELCPTALIFGIWDSTGPKGGLGAKFQRAYVSEVIGINAVVGKKSGSRIDPLQIRSAALVIKDKDGGYTLAENPKQKGAVKPSEINHGNIPPTLSAGGVTVDYAEQTAVLSLPALRRLHFPLADGTRSYEIDTAGQAVLAALALTAAALAAEAGFDLRSRCLLWPTGPLTWELLDKLGSDPTKLTIDSNTAIEILGDAVAAAEALGLKWRKEPLKLTPSPQLVALLHRSQELAAVGAAETEE